MTNPNTRRRCVLPTYERGRPPNNELIQDQGEVAITLVEDGKGGCTCESYAIPENGKFEQEELGNLYLLQALKEENTVKE